MQKMTHFHVGHITVLRRIIKSFAVLLAGGVLVMQSTVAFADDKPSAEQKPPEQAKSEAKPESKPEDTGGGEGQKAVDPAKVKQDEEDKSLAEYKEAATNLAPDAGAPECVWTGRRVASLLWRDDIDTARRYIDLYDRFGCSAEHLKLVFRCVIRQGPIDPKAADRLASRVHGCWITPEEPTTASTQAPTGTAAKGGTIPN